MGGMHPRFRASNEYATDIDAVVAVLKKEYGLPIWVFSMSIGSRSAAGYAVRRPNNLDGLVLASSSTNPPRGKSILDFPLRKITVPVLAVGHENDECGGTPPSGAGQIVALANASSDATARVFSGGRNVGTKPCGLRTYHTFFGIECEVAAAIAEFILTHTP